MENNEIRIKENSSQEVVPYNEANQNQNTPNNYVNSNEHIEKYNKNNIEFKNTDNMGTLEKEINLEVINKEISEGNTKLKNVIFLFINPRSGSEEGKIIFEMVKNNNSEKQNKNILKFLFGEKDGEKQFAYIFNIIDKDHYEMGCELLNDSLNQSNGDESVRILIGGGDGTVLSIIEDFNDRKINISKCYFGHLPLGTGNDLSNALGFGGTVEINSNPKSLKKILNRYYEANTGKIDVWVFKLTVDKDKGEIIEFSKNSKTSKKIENNVYKRSFINYFSIGYDARVGFGFEKKRSGHRCWNKLIYFWEGMKKNMCRKTIPLNSFFESFMVAELRQELAEENNCEIQPKEEEKNYYPVNSTANANITVEDSIINANHKIKTVFKSKMSLNGNRPLTGDNKIYKDIVVKGEPVNIICQNINYYMGGTKDIWRKSGKNIGLRVVEGEEKKLSRMDTYQIEKKLSNSEQSMNDQKLEFFTYSSGFKLGCEKLFTGRADKVYHGPGPILIKFQDTPEKTEKDKFGRVYLNIDGEYFHIIKPLELRVKINNELCGGSVNFLINK